MNDTCPSDEDPTGFRLASYQVDNCLCGISISIIVYKRENLCKISLFHTWVSFQLFGVGKLYWTVRSTDAGMLAECLLSAAP